MERNAKYLLGLTLGLTALVGISFYAYTQSRGFFTGPQLSIIEPANGSESSKELITIAGQATNIARISLNGNPIFVDLNGNFSEKLLLLPGYNILTISAEDRFGKKTEKKLEVVYKQIQNTNPYENTNKQPAKETVASSTQKSV